MKLRRLPLLLFPLLALAMLHQTIPLFMSAMNSLKVEIFLEDWQSRGKTPSALAWETAYHASTTSLTQAPVPNGLLYSQLGELYLWKAYSFAEEDPESAMRSALHAFKTDHHHRPTWPYPLLEMIAIKMRLQETDQEYDQWVTTFLASAHWRGNLLNEFVIDGLYHWPNLNRHQRLTLLETSAQALSMDRRITRNLRSELDNTQLRPLFCLYLTLQPVDTSQLCR